MSILRTLAAATAAAAIIGTAAADAATVDVTTTADTVAVGDTFEVRLAFSAGTLDEFLAGVDAAFDYDGDLFEFVGASFVDDTTGLNQLDLPGDGDNIGGFFEATAVSDGDLAVAAVSGNDFSYLQANQADDFTVFSLEFLAENVGTGTIGLSMVFDAFIDVFDDVNGDPIEFSFLNQSVTVDVAPIPLPSAMIFMLTGAAGLFARRRLSA